MQNKQCVQGNGVLSRIDFLRSEIANLRHTRAAQAGGYKQNQQSICETETGQNTRREDANEPISSERPV